MHMHGIVMTATLQEDPRDPDQVELHLAVQGVGAGQPRRIVVPMSFLITNPDLDPDAIKGHSFQAEVFQEEGNPQWFVSTIEFAPGRVLRLDPS